MIAISSAAWPIALAGLAWWASWSGMAGMAAAKQAATAPTAAETSGDPAEIARLIAELGSSQYAQRERAQAELQRLGLAAFDALHEAQRSDDIEIALRARYLLRSMDIRWYREEDPVRVKEILRGYGDKPAGERKNLMEQIAKLPDGDGLAPLCRMVRFDDAGLLSKQAAVLILQQMLAGDQAGRAWRDVVLAEIGPSQREAADWLRTYIQLQNDLPALLAAWEAIARREEQLWHLAPDKSSPEIVRDLLRWQADLLERMERHEEALAVVLRTVDLLDGTREQLLETVGWLMNRQAWSTVGQVAQRFAERFEESPLLLYRLAESQAKLGLEEAAEQTVQRAMEATGDSPQDHIIAAFALQERGLFTWAERVYRYVLELGPPASQNDLRTRFLLSEMLHDIARDQDAGEALRPAVAAMDADHNVEYLVRRIGRDPGAVRSRMHYFLAQHAARQGQREEVLAQLRAGVQQDPGDADVLIAMYRVPDADPAWRQMTRDHIRQAAEQNRNQIRATEQAAAAAPNEELRSEYNRQLALLNNQLAWLISNTEGDFDEALRCSLRSLEIRPDSAGYLDTLGRCYYAKGDYEQAVRTQSRAVELEPHSGQIQRQLEFFQAALQAAKDAPPQDGASSGSESED